MTKTFVGPTHPLPQAVIDVPAAGVAAFEVTLQAVPASDCTFLREVYTEPATSF